MSSEPSFESEFSSSDSEPTPKRVYLLLGDSEQGEWFYLDIEIDEIKKLCLKPRKYLMYLGWCILGLNAELESLSLGLAVDGKFHAIGNHGRLEDEGKYTLLVDGRPPSLDMAVVDLEVIKARTAVPSETTGTRDRFRKELLKRDLCCIFTGIEADFGEGCHIIPYRRGSDWFKLIIENRPHDDDDVTRGLNDINDIRNGFFGTTLIYSQFDKREFVILKTPNRILNTNEIPSKQNPLPPVQGVEYPENSRYTAQWMVSPGERTLNILPNNSDAAFKINSRAKKPSPLLLHYNYGAAAVKRWGVKTHILDDISKKFRPQKSVNDRRVAIEKRKKASSAARKTGTSKGKGKQTAAWDEDDVMLFFWGNSKAATKRHFKTHKAKTGRVEKWRQGVDSEM